MMLDKWNEIIFSGIKEKLQAAAMKLVAAERNGEAFDSQLVVGVRESYVSLSTDADEPLAIYKSHFERAYLDATEEFYKGRAAQVLEENGVQNYMQYADSKLREEDQRARRYLDTKSDSLEKLLNRCVSVLVVSFQEQVLAECPGLIKADEIDKLRMMFRLIDRSPSGIPTMLKYLDEHIRCEGLSDMVANAQTITSDPEKYVEQLLSMFNRFSTLVRDAFYDDPRFLTARDKAFQEVVNDTTVFKLELQAPKQKGAVAKIVPESKCPELLANYCDLLLRKTQLSKKLTSEEVDAKLSDVLLVLKYVQNKDVFMRFHKAHLSRRLILDMTADQEKEETMVNRLREAGMPADYVNKLYRMLQDIEINKDLNKNFKSTNIGSNNNRNTMADTVNIKILNAGAWSRGGERVPVSLPRELEDFIPEVEDFYKRQHNGRKLQWLHHWSNGTISFANKIGRFDLDVTTFQMAVLFCWNDRPNDRISYENLRLATELPDMELRRTLFSLVAFPKLRQQVLCCDCDSPNPREFTDSTQFWTNDEFCLVKNGKVQVRGRLNLIGRLQLSAEQSRETEHDDIVALRVLRVQEAIVKILKMRKRVQSAQLQTELVEMLKHMFLPSRKLIKEQIEWLMDNHFLKRDDNDINCFVYVA
uniref:Cullin-5 n=1 Tax=Plectus sambesii TaxID=2011161 RepID=A0A914X7H9_9BILA